MIRAMIRIQNVSKSYDAEPAVIDASLELAASEVVTLSGASGSGKTTLLRLIAGLEEPQAGEIHIDGCPASVPGRLLLAPHERGLAMVFQSPALWPHLTVAQNILYGVKEGAADSAGRVSSPLDAAAHQHLLLNRLLEQLEIPGLEDRYPGELSGGQARRGALARALAPRPHCLLLDEPLVNLQPELRARLLDFTLDWVRESGAALLFVTHEPAEAERIPGRRFAMQAGHLCESGGAQ
jgi:iron(III) transport system ATP-binding protein